MLEASLEQVWTLLWHARQIPICQFWHRRVLGAARTTRSPTLLLLSLSGLLLLRYAERQLFGWLFQEPPRFGCLPHLHFRFWILDFRFWLSACGGMGFGLFA